MLSSLGRFCFRRRRAVLAAWLGIFVLGTLLGAQVFGRLGSDYSGSSVESYAGFDRLEQSGRHGPRLVGLLMDVSPADPGVRADVLRTAADLRAVEGVAMVVDPVTAPPAAGLVAPDGRAALIAVDLAPDLRDEAHDAALHAVERRLHGLQAATGGRVLVGGDLLLQRELGEQSERDTQLGEFVALPVTLVVMVFLFGGLVAAGIPFLGALCSIGGGLATLYGLSFAMDLDPAVPSVTTVMGLGLSIDYALLIVSRYREERGLGRGPEDAVVVAMSTAGRTISFSALTVAVSLLGLFAFQDPIFRALGAAGISVIVVALLAGLTLVPALLASFHRRVRAPTSRVPDDGFFARLARATQRRALLVTVVVSALLLAAGSPFLGARFQNGGADLLPEGFESRQFAEAVAARFPQQAAEPVIVVARVPAQRLQAYVDGAARLPQVAVAGRAEAREDGWSAVELVPHGTSQGEPAKALVRALRADRPDFRTWVTGDAAVLLDFQRVVLDGLPWAALVVGLGTFALLFLMTGSVLVPVKALVMNTLSLGATFGVLVWVFQEGHGADLLGFTPTGALETWVPVIVFAFAFGLSMDYEVFLLSRVKELYDAGLPNDKAVELGLQRSGRIITSAALLVVIVFLGFAAGKLLGIKQMGVALATAVAVDATLVRCLLVPATMTLLGDRNWWAPRWLRRVHDRVGLREHVTPPPLPAPTVPATPAARR
jgi:RND superfamily putative drug exporter